MMTACTIETATAGMPGLPLHRAGTGFQRPEQESGEHDPERVATRQEGDGDRGEPVARREVLEQGVGNADDLEPAAQAGERPGEQQGHREERALAIRPLIQAARGPAPTAFSRKPQVVLVVDGVQGNGQARSRAANPR